MQDVLQLWKANKKPLSVYIHSPFCKTTCNYCVYRGTANNSCVNDYYENYLPRMIDFYKEVLASSDVQVIYYGGGTPTLYLDKLVSATEPLRAFQPKEVVLEVHSGLDIDYDLVEKLGVTTAILCQQTFDELQLKSWNRFGYLSPREFEERVCEFHKRGIKVGCDFITCDSTDRDVVYLSRMNHQPDEISIAPMYQSARMPAVIDLVQIIQESNLLSNYTPLHSLNYRDAQAASALSNLKCLRFFKKEFNFPAKLLLVSFRFFSFYTFMSSMDDVLQDYEAPLSILGIGSLNNPDKGTFSKINDDFIYYENWDGKSEYPEFVITKDKTFFDQAREVIDWLESQSVHTGIPAGLRLVLVNKSGDNGFENTYRRNASHNLCWFEVSHPSKNNAFVKQVRSSIRDFIEK